MAYQNSLITHLRDRHCNGDAQVITKQTLTINLDVFKAAEVTFKRMGHWLFGSFSKLILFVLNVGPPTPPHYADDVLDEDVSEVATDENNVDRDQFFQENERVICTTSANNDIQPFNLVHKDIEEVANDLDDNTNDDDVKEDKFEDIASDENDDAELIYEEDESDYDSDTIASPSRKQKIPADVARGHGGDGGGDDRPLTYQVEVNTQRPSAALDLCGSLVPNSLGELIRKLPLHYPSWRQMPPSRSGVVAKMGKHQFDLRPHMESDRWPQIYAGIQQHLQKIYNGKKAALKERYWVPEEDDTYDLERLRRGRPLYISEMETSATREITSLIHTLLLDTYCLVDVFLNPEDKALYDEMLRLQGLGSNTPTGVPYTEDEIMAIVRGGKQRGHIPGVGRVLPGQGTVIPPPSQSTHSTDIARLKRGRSGSRNK
ncbi:hypothetical protein Tco_0090250 [Tanacetum coccineum]